MLTQTQIILDGARKANKTFAIFLMRDFAQCSDAIRDPNFVNIDVPRMTKKQAAIVVNELKENGIKFCGVSNLF